MVGVCLTVIGLIRVVITLGKADTLADDLLASDALLFLTSCLLSYTALRVRSFQRRHRIERAADGIFIVAMVVMTVICGFITYSMSVSADRRTMKPSRDSYSTVPSLFRQPPDASLPAGREGESPGRAESVSLGRNCEHRSLVP